MSSDYDKFRASGIDLGALGAAPGGEAYFCTPRGAQIIGSEGADGVISPAPIRSYSLSARIVSSIGPALSRPYPRP